MIELALDDVLNVAEPFEPPPFENGMCKIPFAPLDFGSGIKTYWRDC
jgi:hypothetical protein